MLVFDERGKRSTRRKFLGAKSENQQTQPTYDAESGNRTRAILVAGECSHHYAIPAPQIRPYIFSWKFLEHGLIIGKVANYSRSMIVLLHAWRFEEEGFIDTLEQMPTTNNGKHNLHHTDYIENCSPRIVN